ncbi:MAG TPA: PQQ-binding-like beta-propeller repeat protein [Alphaproteobacteria bacterium]|nr:PQQ-binding-like beta-propeller repeat protein [Alphaproteobacteria bacterium]
MRRNASSLLCAVALIAAVTAQAAPTVDGRQAPTKDWPMVAGDWGNGRYSQLAEINAANVKQLGGAWMHSFSEEHSRGTPVVVDGMMFVTAGAHVYALNPKTGDVVWTHQAEIAPSNLFKGVAVGDGLVFYGTADAHIVALDEKTGEQKWSVPVGDSLPVKGSDNPSAALTTTGEYISGAPTFAKGMVIVGMSDGDHGVRCRFAAFDAKTGKRVWDFFAIPAPGQIGHETWPQDNDEWQRGGGGLWNTANIDPDLGLVYFGVGNPVPQWAGEVRPGDNLFTDSVVAVDLKTGKYRWHYQVVHHDLWEADVATPLVFYDATVGGKTVKALGAMRTDGYLFLLDRKTGKPVHPVEERPVPQDPRAFTHATQPYPVGADEVGPNCIQEGQVPAGFKRLCHFDLISVDTPNAMYPVLTARSSPMSYDPQTRYFYVAGSPAWPLWIKRFDDPRFFSSQSGVPGMKTTGILAAIDSRTDKIVWQKNTPYEMQNGSGATTTAGGLLFHGEPDGNLQALDAKTGDVLWQFQTGANESGPAAVYEIDGQEYVAVLGTQNLWAFRLGGTLPPLPAPPIPPTETSFAGRVVSADAVSMAGMVRDTGLEKVRQAYNEFAFLPTRIKVAAGTKVTWTNNGKVPHNATAQDGSWSTGDVPPGGTATVTFAKPGSYTYIDKDHPFAFGQVNVQ